MRTEDPNKTEFKLTRVQQAFGLVVLACLCITSIGFLYDASMLGTGIKTSGGVALGVLAIILLIAALAKADEGKW